MTTSSDATGGPDPVAQIAAELREDGVHVGPGLGQHVDATELAEIEAAVARTDDPVHVIAVRLDDEDMFGGSAQDLIARVHDELGTDGWFVALSYVFDDGNYSLVQEGWSTTGSGVDLGHGVLGIAEHLHPNDLGAGLAEMTTAIADGTVTEKTREAQEAFDDRHGTGTGAGTGAPAGDADGGLPTTGVVLALVVLVAVVGVLAARARRRAPADGGLRDAVTPAAHKRYTLPASVLDRVRAADDARLRSRAEQQVLALGERIDDTGLETSGDTAAWQAALDHYDGARRVLSRAAEAPTGPDLLDVVGAIVLAERGDAALTAAEAGKAYRPAPHCFLNPLHGRATARRKLDHEGRRLDVPVCQQCRHALGSGERPDILDVERRGKPVHYFDAGAEPWSATGYGALDPDLIPRLHGRT